jgi:hypothetical protein
MLKIKKIEKNYLYVFFKKSLLKNTLYHNINLSVFVSVVASAFEANHRNKTFGKMANAIYCVQDPPQLTFQTRVSRKQHLFASPFLLHLCMCALRV